MTEIGEGVNVTTLAFAMHERGYRPAAKNNSEFVKSLRSALRRNNGQMVDRGYRPRCKRTVDRMACFNRVCVC
jgi:hypothetical protein